MTITENPPTATEPAATNGTEPQPAPTNVVAALARVMGDLPGIGRTEHSEQGYDYRGIESITRHAQSLFARYGIVFVPRVERREVKELTINNRPWTEDQAWIVYRIYGPGGVEDYIEVGPFVGLGRDNSDKGMNKAMTQAFKYALIQTLCIGDAKDDPDREVAHEADAKRGPVDPDRQARLDLAARIRTLTPVDKEQIRSFCDENKIPRVTAQMTDAQLEQVDALVDTLLIGRDAEPAADVHQEPDTEPEPDDAAPAVRAAQVAAEAGVDPAAVIAEDERRAKARDDAQQTADSLEGEALDATLAQFDCATTGTEPAKRKRLVEAMVAAEMAQPAGDGALPLG